MLIFSGDTLGYRNQSHIRPIANLKLCGRYVSESM